MPKKYHQKSLLTKPSTSAPSSLALSHPSSSNQQEGVQRTVNELIRESRREQGLPQRIHATPSPSSIHPALRAVLDIPSPPPPPLRHGLRGPTRLRRIPGPPPPPSWLNNSRYAKPQSQRAESGPDSTRWRIARNISILPEGQFPQEHSFQHLILRAISSNWSWHVEYDHIYLAELPTSIKETLLSYVSIYGDHVGPNPLRVLFPSDLDDDEVGQVRRLDLGNAIGGWATVKSIGKDLLVSQRHFLQATPQPSSDEAVPDSWDSEEPETVQTLSKVPTMAANLRYHSLKHLSLAAVPGTPSTAASWQDVLNLATKLPTITSLSLAYWPQPTYTPNASTGRHKISTSNPGSSPTVIYGGTDFYSAFDNNWREAAGILRTLSRSLYCLRWLDLTGCGEWFPSLTWQPDEYEDESDTCGPDWNGGWRGLEHLILAVGWKPSIDAPKISTVKHAGQTLDSDGDAAASGSVNETITRLSRTRLGQDSIAGVGGSPPWNVEQERAKYLHRQEVEKYMKLSNCAKKVAQDLRIVRKQSGMGWIQVEFGEDDEMVSE